MPLKIAIDGRCLNDHYPGIGRYVFQLLRALPTVADDAEIVVLTDPSAASSRFDLDVLAGEGVRQVASTAPIRGFAQQRELPKQLQQLGCDVFHAPYFLTAYRVPCPMVVGIYDTIPARFPETLPSPAARMAVRLGVRMALRSARVVLTLSRFAKDDLAATHGLPEDRFAVTPAAAAEHFQPAADETVAELRSRLDLPRKYVLHVGTNKPHKNLERLVEAWTELRTAGKADGWGLVLAGAHNPRHFSAEDAAQRLGPKGLRLLGAVAESDLPTLYSGAEIFVLPSLYEGFGLPVLEAMACGTVVACAKASSLPEVAAHAAAYFEAEDTASIVQTLGRLLKNPGYGRVLAERGRARAAQLTWRQTARLTLDAYRRAVAAR